MKVNIAVSYIVHKLFCRKLFHPGYYVQVILDELFQGGAGMNLYAISTSNERE